MTMIGTMIEASFGIKIKTISGINGLRLVLAWIENTTSKHIFAEMMQSVTKMMTDAINGHGPDFAMEMGRPRIPTPRFTPITEKNI